jgi:hypothetical protein
MRLHPAVPAHMMSAPLSLWKALAQEARARDRLRANNMSQLWTVRVGTTRVLV